MKWILLTAAGASTLAGLAWLRRSHSNQPDPEAEPGIEPRSNPARPRPVHRAPVALHFAMKWPVPLYQGRKPRISSGHRSDNASRPKHKGVDIMYRRRPEDTQRARGDGAGSKRFIMPEGIPAIAAGPGRVTKAKRISTGGIVKIDHGRGIQTWYLHLERIDVVKGQQITTGQTLGLIGDNPKATDPRHLHFELRRRSIDLNPRDYLPR